MTQNSDDNIYDSRETGELKNQYSTFIEELQQTTEKLMDEVFNTPYEPQQLDQPDPEKAKPTDRVYRHKYSKKYTNRSAVTDRDVNFNKFLTRNSKWYETRQKKIDKEVEKKNKMIESTLTEIPKITRGSIQKLNPIYQRCLDIQHEREQKLAFKRIDKKKIEQEKFNKIPFQPKINRKNRNDQPRSLQEYLRDKQEWLNKKNETIKVKRLLTEAGKYEECIFTPILTTDRYNAKHNMTNRQGKIQERLLRSLEKSIEKNRFF